MHYAGRLLKNCKSKLVVKDFVFSHIVPIVTYCLHVYVSFLNKLDLKTITQIIKRIGTICQVKKEDMLTYVEKQINKAAEDLYNNIILKNLHKVIFPEIQASQRDLRSTSKQNNFILPSTNNSLTQKGFIYRKMKAIKEGTKFFTFEDSLEEKSTQ
ncbi:Uncharacterised protein at_DN0034 [Pycnogonum litorale]